MILVDSSVWIAAWRGNGPSLLEILGASVEAGEAGINLLIRTELLQGARDKKHQRALMKLLEPVPILPFPDNFWDEAPAFYLKCREDGIRLTTMDSLIAIHAILLGISLWSLDTTFSKIRGLRQFKI